MRTVKPHRAGKRLLTLLLVLVFSYPGITASNADFLTTNELFEQMPQKKEASPTGVGKTRKKTLDQKRAALMYYYWFALKHNRSS